MKKSLTEELSQLYQQHFDKLGHHSWIYEKNRLNELFFCLISKIGNDTYSTHRKLITILEELNLLEIQNLILLEKGNSDYKIICSVCEKLGFTQKEAKQICGVLHSTAVVLYLNYDSKIQKLLRVVGNTLKNELKNVFKDIPIKKEDLDFGCTLWLQNALNFPLTLNANSIKIFCKSKNITMDQLTNIADEANLNLAVLDDIIEGSTLKQ